MSSKNFFLISSAALYAASFFYPDLLWWGSFVFLIPLFLATSTPLKKPVINALVWSLLAYAPVIVSLAAVLYDSALAWYSYTLVGVFAMLFFIPTAVWFYVLVRAARTAFYPYIFFITALTHSWCVCHVVLMPVGVMGGYPLVFPLLPIFMVFPLLAKGIWCGGKFALLACTYALQVSSLVCKKNLFVLLPLLIGWCISSFLVPPTASLEDIMCVVCPKYERQGLRQLACAQQALMQAVSDNPKALAFVLPESVIPFDHKKIPYLATLLTDEVGIRQQPVLFGTHSCRRNKTFNSLGVAHHGRITIGYVKKKLVPFFECFHVFERGGKAPLLLNPKKAFSPGADRQVPLYVPGVGYCSPIICSECLWGFPYGQPFPVLLVVHDGHFRFLYTKRLMRTYAVLQAGACNMPLIYSSYA